MISRYGIIPISSKQDTAGPMDRTVRECALMMDYLYGPDVQDETTLASPQVAYHFLQACNQNVQSLKIGFLSFQDRPYSQEEQDILNEAQTIFQRAGCRCLTVELSQRRINNMEALLHEFKADINHYLKTVKQAAKINCLTDIIRFNQINPSIYMPYGQDILELADKTSGLLCEEAYLSARCQQLQAANAFTQLIEKYDLDVVVTVHGIAHTAISGCPSLSVPGKALNDSFLSIWFSLQFIGKMKNFLLQVLIMNRRPIIGLHQNWNRVVFYSFFY